MKKKLPTYKPNCIICNKPIEIWNPFAVDVEDTECKVCRASKKISL